VNAIRQLLSETRRPGANSPEESSHVLARLLAPRRPLVMGILNITPDSFSDGGQYLAPRSAIEHARHIVREGADILDIGAESTRPYGGAVKISAEAEWGRLEPVLPAATALGIPVSIDTMKAKVASDALASGVTIINDVWGLQRDRDMARVVAEHGAPIVIMHNRDAVDPAIDIMADIAAFFSRSLDIAARAGIADDRIVLDPGIGFGKTPEQSMTAIARLAELKAFGKPLLVGASRKRFIDSVSASAPDQRLGGSIASHLLAVECGAAIVRAHDVAETIQALRVASAIRGAR
jgi:dihydropteroate synthase